MENSRLIMQPQYKNRGRNTESRQASRGRGACRRQPGGPIRLPNQRGAQVNGARPFRFYALIWSANIRSGKLWPAAPPASHATDRSSLSHLPWFCMAFLSTGMDFILPPTPVGGIQWEKVLPPLIPRLNGTHGQYKWSPNFLLPEPENSHSAGVGQLRKDKRKQNMRTHFNCLYFKFRYIAQWHLRLLKTNIILT